ncbi:MAG: sulfite exporter TauE/SafE family protein [Lysobacterales bacterium]
MPELSTELIVAIAALAFATGVLHGAAGMAGGVVMAAVLSLWLGIKVAIPVMTCALVFSHASRVWLYRKDISWPITARVLIFGVPTTVIGALTFVYLEPAIVALVMALVLSLSFPIKHWARRRQLSTSPKVLSMASAVWGMLAGNVIGPGFFLAPFLLGTGINRLTFVGTLAMVTGAINVIKLAVFGGASIMSADLFTLGVLIGLATIPGNLTGRYILTRIGDAQHRGIVDVLTLLMIGHFFYLCVTTR